MRFSSRTARERSAADDSLTPSEVRVLQLIAKGNANKEIAEQLSISEETVKGQVRNILSNWAQTPYGTARGWRGHQVALLLEQRFGLCAHRPN